jgi:hypothetical protein
MSWNKFRPFTDYIDIKHYTGHEGNTGTWKAKLATQDPKCFSQAEGCYPVSGEAFDYRREDDNGNSCEIACGVYFIRIKDKSAKNNIETPSGYYDYIGLSANFKKNSFSSGIFKRISDHYRKLVCLPARGNFLKLITKYALKVDISNLTYEEIKKYRPEAEKSLRKKYFKNYDELREYFGASHIKDDINLYDTTESFHKVFQECKKRNDLNTIEGINKFFTENVRIAFYEHKFIDNNMFVLNNDGSIKIKSGIPQINGSWKNFVQFISKGEGVALATYKKEYGKLPFLNSRDEIKSLDNLPKGFN